MNISVWEEQTIPVTLYIESKMISNRALLAVLFIALQIENITLFPNLPASKLPVPPWVRVEPSKTADVGGENWPGASGWECPGSWPQGYKIILVSDKIQSRVSLCHQMDWKELPKWFWQLLHRTEQNCPSLCVSKSLPGHGKCINGIGNYWLINFRP